MPMGPTKALRAYPQNFVTEPRTLGLLYTDYSVSNNFYRAIQSIRKHLKSVLQRIPEYQKSVSKHIDFRNIFFPEATMCVSGLKNGRSRKSRRQKQTIIALFYLQQNMAAVRMFDVAGLQRSTRR